jgi:hypothetical protein
MGMNRNHDDDEPLLDERQLWEFCAACILIAEGAVPPKLKPGPANVWAKAHVSRKLFRETIARAQTMTPAERGIHIRKAMDGECDA